MVNGVIIGIDPGSTNLGVGVLFINPFTYVIERSTAFTLNANKLHYQDHLAEHQVDRIMRLRALQYELLQTFCYYRPYLVASESPFYNRFRPNAYGVLVETISVIRAALCQYDPYAVLHTVDPPTVKKAVGVLGKIKGKDKKSPVKDKVAQLSALYLEKDIESLDEHAVDAVAVAYAYYKQFLGARHHEFSQL